MDAPALRFLAVSSMAACLALAPLACAGAAGDDPPYEGLPLRDALTADPAVIASLTADARRELAERLEEARLAEHDTQAAIAEPDATPAREARALDEAREARGTDTLVVAAMRRSGMVLEAEPLAADVRAEPASPRSPLPPLEGPTSNATAALEAQALAGHAGEVLAELVQSSGARRLVRVTGWPSGAVAAGDVVYVNAAWLVALADEPAAVAVSPSAPPPARPMSLAGNPYLTYGSLEACTADVTARCKACLQGGTCDSHAALGDFADGRAECVFLEKDADRPEELCVAGLGSIATVAACVRSAAPSCPLPTSARTSADLVDASPFLGKPSCVAALDACLAGAPSTIDVHVKVDGCQDPFSACASSFKGLSSGCKIGSCSRKGSGGSSSTSSGSGSSSSTSSGAGGASSGGSSSGGGSTSGGGGSSSGGGGSTSGGGGGGSTSGSSGCSSCKSTGSGSSSSSCSSCKSGGSSKSCKCQTEAPDTPLPAGSVAWVLAPLAFVMRSTRRPS